jgi:hypothetical protein
MLLDFKSWASASASPLFGRVPSLTRDDGQRCAGTSPS